MFTLRCVPCKNTVSRSRVDEQSGKNNENAVATGKRGIESTNPSSFSRETSGKIFVTIGHALVPVFANLKQKIRERQQVSSIEYRDSLVVFFFFFFFFFRSVTAAVSGECTYVILEISVLVSPRGEATLAS